MKNLKISLFLLLALPLHLFAQDLDCRFFEWSKEWKHNGSSSNVALRSPIITSDSIGNSYFGGQFSGSLDFGNTTLWASGGFSIFIAKVDSSGQPIWAAQASSTQSGNYIINLMSIKLDAYGNTNIIGIFRGNVTFGNHALSAPFQNGNRGFFAQLNPQGQFIKAIELGTTPVGIDLDAMGNIYMVGSFQSTITLGSFTLSPSGLEDIFIAKMNNQGQFIWAKQFGGVGNNIGRDIAVDGVGNSYITGHFNGELTFGSTVLNNTQNASYVAKLDPSGQVVWAKHINNSNSNGRSIAIDSAGNSFIIGIFTDSMLINGQMLKTIDFTSFVAKVNPQGEFTDAVKFWDRNNIGSINSSYYENNSNYISVNSSTRSVYISSLYYDSLIVNGVTYATQQQLPRNQVYFAELSTEKLALKWILPSYGAARILTSGISHDAKGNCYATGVFRNGGLILGNDTFSSNEISRYLTKIASLNNLVMNTSDTLTAVQTNVNYQWLDCANNMAPIPGATSRTFYPGTIGQYAVALSNDFCTDTSACLQTTAIRQLSPLEKITVYPNPASSEITLDKLPRGSAITLYDLSGRKLRSVSNKEESSVHLSVQDLAEGLYFVEIVQQGNRVFKKVVVMKRE